MWFHYKRLYQKGEGNWRTEHPAHYVIAMGKPVYVGLVSPLFLGIMTLVLYSYYINEFSFGQNALILAIWYIFLGVIIGVSFALIKWAAACRSLNLSNPSMRIWPIYLSFAIVFGHVLYSVWMIS